VKSQRLVLIAAVCALVAVIIIGVAFLASTPVPQGTPQEAAAPAVIVAPVAQAPAAAPKPEINPITWHAEPRPAPATVFQDGNETDATLADFKGKALLVNFWATWCAPCITEMPTLNILQRMLGGEDFQVLTISQDREGLAVAAPFFEKNEWKELELYVDPGMKFTKDTPLRGLPTTLIINAEGQEIGRLEGVTEWNAPEVIGELKEKLGLN